MPGTPRNDVTVRTVEILRNFLSELTPASPFVGYYQLVETLGAWVAFTGWMEERSPESSPAWVPSEPDSSDTDTVRLAIAREHESMSADAYERREDASPSRNDFVCASLARSATHLLSRYLSHASAHLFDPATATTEQITKFAGVRGRVENLQSLIALRDAADTLKNAEDGAKEAARDAREATAQVATKRLAANYSNHAKYEGALSWGFLIVAVGVVIGTGVYAFNLHLPNDISIGAAVQHIATLAILLGLAGFLARQAARRQTNARWSKALDIQLSTFEDYISPIEDAETRNQVRLMFATRVFGSTPDADTDAAANDISWIPQLVAALAESRNK